MEDLSRRELLALKEIHLTGQTSDKGLVRNFVEEGIVADIAIDNLLLTHKGLGLLVRGSPSLWDSAA